MSVRSKSLVVGVVSLLAILLAAPAMAATVGDYDGDGKTDFAVWRPSTGTWYINPSNTITQQWGLVGDIPVPGDYDGDGKLDFAVWRPSIGQWFIIPSSNPTTSIVQSWGLLGDIPVPGDYYGEGQTDYAVWRPSDGTWYIKSSKSGNTMQQSWGLVGDIPVPGDYYGEGQTDYAVWRPSGGTWYIKSSKTGNTIQQSWGLLGDIPVPGDYYGEGQTDYAVWRPSGGTWYIKSSKTGNTIQQSWGSNGDIPVPGDYDGDGKTDYAVWRPSTGTWYVIPSSNPGTPITQQWGTYCDTPIDEPIGATLPQGCGVWSFDTSDAQHNPQANTASTVTVGPVTPSQVDELAFLAISQQDSALSASAGWVPLFNNTPTGVFVNTYQTNGQILQPLVSQDTAWATNILLFKGLWSLPLTQPITSVQVSNHVVTCQAVNNFIVGTQVLINSVNSDSGQLNGNTYKITAATPTSFQFSAPGLSDTGPNSENGTATNLPYLQPKQVDPHSPGSWTWMAGSNQQATISGSFDNPLTAGSTVVAVLITGDNNAYGDFNMPASVGIHDDKGDTFTILNNSSFEFSAASVAFAQNVTGGPTTFMISATTNFNPSGVLLLYELPGQR